eukprot:743625-Pleurochrysis_carterae.AAC.1
MPKDSDIHERPWHALMAKCHSSCAIRCGRVRMKNDVHAVLTLVSVHAAARVREREEPPAVQG